MNRPYSSFALASIVIAGVALACPIRGQAQSEDRSLRLDQLGRLNLEFTQAIPASRLPGAPVRAEVTHRPGAAFRLYSPRRVQQADYLVEPGQFVTEGQAVIRLIGPEIHHWRMEYDAIRTRFDLADDRYRRNQPLFESHAISESNWLEIVDQWQSLRLEFEHMRHFAELLDLDAGDENELVVISPYPARVDYPVVDAAPDQDELIVAFVPVEAYRLKLRIPARPELQLEIVSAGDCRLAVEQTGDRISDFLLDAWSEPLVGRCDLKPGQVISAIPYYAIDGNDERLIRVPGSALLAWDHRDFLLRRDGDSLSLHEVNVLTRDGGDYLVQGPAELVDAEVLISSVSAVQGILMGLGGE